MHSVRGGERKVTYTLLISCLYVFPFSHTPRGRCPLARPGPATRGVMGVERLPGRSFVQFRFFLFSEFKRVGKVLINCGRL